MHTTCRLSVVTTAVSQVLKSEIGFISDRKLCRREHRRLKKSDWALQPRRHMIYAQLPHDSPRTPGTPVNGRKARSVLQSPVLAEPLLTPTASLLVDASNVYGLNKFSAALVADIAAKSFHNQWEDCYREVLANDVRSTQPLPLHRLLFYPQHVPAVAGLWNLDASDHEVGHILLQPAHRSRAADSRWPWN